MIAVASSGGVLFWLGIISIAAGIAVAALRGALILGVVLVLIGIVLIGGGFAVHV